MSRPLIAAHRGVCGGNIPCNTLEAFDIAIRHGADIVELDVSRSEDGKLYVFHPEMEPAHLYSPRTIARMRAEEVSHLHYVNYDRTWTQFPVTPFDDALEHLKGRCVINVDKFYLFTREITDTIRRHGMQDQVIVKTHDKESEISLAIEAAPDLPLMIMTRRDDFSAELQKRHPRYMGTEVLFTDDSDPLAGLEYIDRMHRMGLKLWVNAIVYNHRSVLAGGHNDDISVIGREDEGWGWLIDRGYDIIQTDWTLPLRLYLENRGK